jgi:hypothetical protein
MKTRAVSMVLLMIASALAGCTTGDPDGDGELGIDTDVLNQMIEDNLQDFINNSSVTVHQTIHYHNNTTYVDNSESNTNVGGGSGSGSNGTMSGSIMQVYRIQDSAPYQTEDFGNNTFILNGILQYPAIGIAPDLIYTIGSTTISLTLTCNEYYNANNRMNHDAWTDWLRYEEGISYDDAWQLGYDIEDDLAQLSDEAQQYCMYGWNDQVSFSSEMLEIELLTGETMQFIDITGYWNYNISCDDGYFAYGNRYGVDNNNLLGGWSDCTFTIYQTWSVDVRWNSVYTNSSNTQTFNIPDWFTYGNFDQWRYIDSESGTAEHDSIIYFTKYFVVPLE